MEAPDRYCEPLWQTQQRRRRSWLVYVVLLVVLLGAAAALASCAQVPYCPSFQSKMITDDEEENVVGVFFDARNAIRLAMTVKGLSEGTCRMAPQGTRL